MVDNRNTPKGRAMLEAQLSLFPGDSFWLEQAAHAKRQMESGNKTR
jgi:hypothetical protein